MGNSARHPRSGTPPLANSSLAEKMNYSNNHYFRAYKTRDFRDDDYDKLYLNDRLKRDLISPAPRDYFDQMIAAFWHLEERGRKRPTRIDFGIGDGFMDPYEKEVIYRETRQRLKEFDAVVSGPFNFLVENPITHSSKRPEIPKCTYNKLHMSERTEIYDDKKLRTKFREYLLELDPKILEQPPSVSVMISYFFLGLFKPGHILLRPAFSCCHHPTKLGRIRIVAEDKFAERILGKKYWSVYVGSEP